MSYYAGFTNNPFGPRYNCKAWAPFAMFSILGTPDLTQFKFDQILG